MQRFSVPGAIVLLALVGLSVRLAIAIVSLPGGADPVFSYTYRALLIANGDWSGVLLMWHPPGYPLLLALLTVLSAGHVGPYAWGVVSSLAAFAGLVIVVDRLSLPRVRFPATRIAIASFVALYETLVVVGGAPLTEPLFMLLVYLAILQLDAPRPAAWRWAAAGILLGVAGTIRLEGMVSTLGVTVLAAWRCRGRTSQGIRDLVCFLLGFAVAAGWLLLQVDYLRLCSSYQVFSYSVPAAHGLPGQLLRIVECLYFACTRWLPQVLLLPYWLLAAIGGFALARPPERRRLGVLLVATLGPILAAVTLTVMHKRTGVFLLPAAAILVGLGVEQVGRLLLLRGIGYLTTVLAFVVLNGLQLVRVPLWYARHPPAKQRVTYVQGELLRRHAAGTAPVWAYGSEPEVYAFWGQPVAYDFFGRELRNREVRSALANGGLEGFVTALRQRGTRYLTFVLADRPTAAAEPQPFDGFAFAPERQHLQQLVAHPHRYDAALLGRARADDDSATVYLLDLAGKWSTKP